MFKKTLISLAVASSLGLTGCFDSASSGKNANPDYQIEDTTIDKSLVRPIFDPNPLSQNFSVPTHFDLLLLLGATLGANHDFTAPASGPEPVSSALDSLSGFSTTSAFNVRFDGELNADSVIAGQTVFLIALETDSPLKGTPAELALPAVNPADIAGLAPDANQPKFRAEAVDVDNGVNNAIRITPLEPLEEGRKYLVLVGNGVKGANGKSVDQSVQGRAIAEGALGNAALANVKAIVSGLNDLGTSIIGVSGQEVALSYTFTTNSDSDVLRAMAAPIPYLTALGQKVGFTAQLKAVRDNFPDLNFSELTAKLADLGEKATQLEAGAITPADLTAEELNALTDLGAASAIAENIPAAVQAQIGTTLHVAQPRPFVKLSDKPATDLLTIQSLAPADGTPVNEWNPIYAAATQVTVSQGAVTLPYYQHLPGESGDGITDGFWTGNTDLEDSLNTILAGEGQEIFKFLRDADGSLNVNGNFPFPQLQGTTTVPVVVFRPNVGASQPDACLNSDETTYAPAKGVTILQHGITVDRSAAMLPAISLAASTCQAVVAIDQPLHGLAGDNEDIPGIQPGTLIGLDTLDDAATTELKTKAEQIQAAYVGALGGDPSAVCGEPPTQAAQYACLQVDLMGKLLSSDYFGERHFNFTNDGSLNAVSAPIEEVSSGSLFINPLNMLNSRDNLRQGVVDLLNLSSTVQLMPILDGNGDGLDDPIFNGLPVNFVGHSLGGISGSVYASLANDPATQFIGVDPETGPISSPTAEYLPELNSVVLHDTGGQVTRLIENSPSISPAILGGLASKGVVQGTSDFENFFYIFQSLLDGGDPVTFANELGAFGDSLLITEVVGDSTVPNEANVNPLGSAFSAPLAGTEPLMALLDIGAGGTVLADGTEGLGIMELGAASGSQMPVATFFDGTNPCSDANHGTFVAPVAPNDQCPGGVADTSVAFSAMVRQTGAALSGLTIPATSQDVQVSLGDSTTLENALDQDQAQ